MKDIIIAIDGFAGCGKSTTAKQVAERLDYLYIDSGAMYRAVSLYFLKNNISFESDSLEMKRAMENIFIDFVFPDNRKIPHIVLNGAIIEDQIRSPEISAVVSKVSVHASVRRELVSQQRRLGVDGGVVMDGRDIGTVVFPHADLKVFLTADIRTRSIRRKKELEAKGIVVSVEEVEHNLLERDKIDSERKISPIKQASDAIVIDTTNYSIEQQVEKVVNLALERM